MEWIVMNGLETSEINQNFNGIYKSVVVISMNFEIAYSYDSNVLIFLTQRLTIVLFAKKQKQQYICKNV